MRSVVIAPIHPDKVILWFGVYEVDLRFIETI
jgi:hypothetical protein